MIRFNIILGDKKGNISLEIITCKKKVILKSKFTGPNQNEGDTTYSTRSNEIPWPVLFQIDKDFDLTIFFKRDKYMVSKVIRVEQYHKKTIMKCLMVVHNLTFMNDRERLRNFAKYPSLAFVFFPA
jgi:hypothetical protein